jgi:beta-galactosidase
MNYARLFLALTTLCPALIAQTPPAAKPDEKPKPVRNNDFYPPSAEARKFIDYDGAGYTIDGHRTYLASGTLHYPRVPQELWADRLTRLKQAGFRSVETYAFWNLHEPRENDYTFSGEADIEKFLKTAQELGLYSIVRVGPYVCAEWDAGGWPVWLKFKPSMKLRTADPEFLKWSDHWYDKILPIVARHQISRGGNVIMVQLENEHPAGWGVVKGDPYFDHLAAQAPKHGIEIPYFMSGFNHGGNPTPGGQIDPSNSKTPWMSTEFWAGWFDSYRTVSRKKNAAIDDAIWRNLSRGGGGYNIYMLHGGSNFANWSDNSTGASYDFGAAIGQTGDLRPMYYRMKRANQLALGFPDIFANSTEDRAITNFASGDGVEFMGARRGVTGAGTFAFLRNRTNKEVTAQLQGGGSVRLARGGYYPFPIDVQLAPGVTLVSSTLPVLTRAVHDGVVSVVIYGQPGDTGEIVLKNRAPQRVTVPEQGVAETTVANVTPGLDVRLLVINQDLTLNTWLVGSRDRQTLVFGPAFVRGIEEKNGRVASVLMERFYGAPSPGRVSVYGARGPAVHLIAPANTAIESAPAPALGAWTMAVTSEADPAFDDRAWFKSPTPPPLGADGDNGNFGWYRTTVNAPAAGRGTLQFKFKDNVVVFVNGQRLAEPNAPADYKAGANTVAILAAHIGRNKGYNFLGDITTYDTKGITSDVVLNLAGQKQTLTDWRLRGGLGNAPAGLRTWKPLGDTAGHPAFYRTTFKASPPAETGALPILRITYAGLSRGMVWLNGHTLGRYPEKIRIDSLYLPEVWLRPEGNELVIFDESGASPSAVSIIVERESSREIIRAAAPADARTAMLVPQEFPARDLAKMNAGNIAYLSAATASSQGGDTPASAATDGDTDTRWAAAKNQKTGALTVDLGKPQTIRVCEIVWAAEQKSYRYTLEGSLDGTTWKKLGDHTTAVPTSPDSPSELSRLNLDGAQVRYLRVDVQENRNPSITEFRAFN